MSFAPKKEVWDATHERDADVVDRAPGTASTSHRAATKGVPPAMRMEPSLSFADDESSDGDEQGERNIFFHAERPAEGPRRTAPHRTAPHPGV